MAYFDPSGGDGSAPPAQPIHQQIPDASNPAAQAFAVARLHQLVSAHLLGGMPQNMNDAAQVWRGLSGTLQQNPQALQSFLAAGHQQPDPLRGGYDQGYGLRRPGVPLQPGAYGPAVNHSAGQPFIGSGAAAAILSMLHGAAIRGYAPVGRRY